jgi:hypothetical protein
MAASNETVIRKPPTALREPGKSSVFSVRLPVSADTH